MLDHLYKVFTEILMGDLLGNSLTRTKFIFIPLKFSNFERNLPPLTDWRTTK
jgi:hypothetical protein